MKRVPAPTPRNIQPARGNTPRHEDCWAKTTEHGAPGINVRNHCLNVGAVAEALLELLPTPLQMLLPQSAVTLAAVHDIGKVSPGFQAKCESWLVQRALKDQALEESWSAREADHAKVSQFTVQELLRASKLQRWAAAVGAHPGWIKGERVRVCEPWEGERSRLARELINEFGPLPDEPPTVAALWFLAGLITVADWIGSDERRFPQDAPGDVRERRRRARNALAAIDWKPLEAKPRMVFVDCFPEILRPNNLQTVAMQAVQEPGVYIFEAPMGSGKTEAALAAAYKLLTSQQASGLYFALPTQVTSNRIHLRVQPFLDRIATRPTAARLAHSASWLVEREPPALLRPAIAGDKEAGDPIRVEARDHVRAGRSWFASAKRALLVPFGVGTVDQALLGIVAAKHFFVRQFGLAGKVVVLDEVHSYDIYTGTLIEKLVERLRELQCTVIILSATLTEGRRRDLLRLDDAQAVSPAYPLVSGKSRSFIEQGCEPPPSKTVRVRRVPGTLPLEEALARAAQGECVLWIRNTVNDAQETFRALQSARFEGGPSIALLHSRFPFFRREELENEWMTRLGKDPAQRPAGCVLVSTQVAEQSVDIDADLLITDLAPTDMLLQRLGRLWRHHRPARSCLQPDVWIQTPLLTKAELRRADAQELKRALGKSARVYAPYVLLRSLEQWWGREAITLPEGIRLVLEATYADAAAGEPLGWEELRRQLEKKREEMAQQALSATLVWTNPALRDEEGVQTRFSTCPMAHLLLARQISRLNASSVRLDLLNGDTVTASEYGWRFEVAKAIHRNLAPVPQWAVAAGLAERPAWLTLHVAQAAAVGVVQTNGELSWPGGTPATPALRLAYHPDQGVIIHRDRVTRTSHEEYDESYD